MAICRRYKKRLNTETIETTYRNYYLGLSYYKDDGEQRGDIVMGWNVRVQFESNTDQFEIVVQRAYQQQPNTGVSPIDSSISFVTIERRDYALS